jgi:dihydrofolate reductase
VPDNGVYTFVSSVEEAANVAARLAGGKDVDVVSASIGTQLLRAGLIDEIRIHLVPVLLGAGTRLLDDAGPHIRIQPTGVVQSPRATHLRYRVIKNA